MQVAASAGLGESAIRQLESGKAKSQPRPTTLRAVSEALGWTPDSAEHILAGEKPVEATAAEPAEHTGDGGLEARVARLEAELAAVQRQIAERDAAAEGYDVNLDDPEERELWGLTTFPAEERWRLILHLRDMRAEREREAG